MTAPLIKAPLPGHAGTNLYNAPVYRGSIVIGSSGAITSQRGGFVTVTNTGTGVYLFTFQGKWGYHTGVSARSFAASNVPLDGQVTTDALATAGTLEITMRNPSGTATNPASGQSISWTISLSDHPRNPART